MSLDPGVRDEEEHRQLAHQGHSVDKGSDASQRAVAPGAALHPQ